jgi:hypothetical protein
MNYLVYLGLQNYDTPSVDQARRNIAARSLAMFLTEWAGERHIHENYSALGSDSDTVANSDTFLVWGALMGWIGVAENEPTQMTGKTLH